MLIDVQVSDRVDTRKTAFPPTWSAERARQAKESECSKMYICMSTSICVVC